MGRLMMARRSRRTKMQEFEMCTMGESFVERRHKRVCSPGIMSMMPHPKRSSLSDITNYQPVKTQSEEDTVASIGSGSESEDMPSGGVTVPDHSPHGTASTSNRNLCTSSAVTPVMNFLQATTLQDESWSPEEEEEVKSSTDSRLVKQVKEKWKDIYVEEVHDPLVSEYAPGIYKYMKQREVNFALPGYNLASEPYNTASMRAGIVDWFIDVQGYLLLYQETLYLAVQLMDRYFSIADDCKECRQLVGVTCMLIATKFEEPSPPLVGDILFLCDYVYSHRDLITMEKHILKKLNYDVNIPVAYQFLSHLAWATGVTIETLTLARYICENTLQDCSFVIDKPSCIAAGALYLALRIKSSPWTPSLERYSGYSVCDLLPLVHRLNSLLLTPLEEMTIVRCKYLHKMFFSVAALPALDDIEADVAAMAMLTNFS